MKPLLGLLVALATTTAQAAPKNIHVTLKGATLSSDATLLAVSQAGQTSQASFESNRVTISPPDKKVRLYVLQNNQVTHGIFNLACSGKEKIKCSARDKVTTQYKAGARFRAKLKGAGTFLSSLKGAKFLASVAGNSKVDAENGIVESISALGLGSAAPTAIALRISTDSSDSDSDGLVDALDVDDDDDGVIDNYDSDGTRANTETSFYVFSNFKLAINNSLNLHTTGLSAAQIDTALQNNQTLAIGIAGADGDNVELDCGTLAYCTSGGTGSIAAPGDGTPFPGSAGGTYDPDGDGFGTISAGATGDFQLKTGASASSIAAGDALIQKITASDSTESEVAGILNFVFNSNPAVKSVSINSATAVNVDYSADPIIGGPGNCFEAPASGAVTLQLTGYRPQRPGVPSSGESEYVDLGNSIVTIDAPSAACADETGTGCNPNYAICLASTLSSSDLNLSPHADGLQDTRGDINASSSNTYTFDLDLTSCLQNHSSGPVSWSAGQTVFLELQFKSRDGDNASQKFCITRATS